MTENIQLTETAKQIQATIRPALNQLDIAQGKVTGIAETSVKAAIMLVEQAEQMAIDLTNQDYDDYNELVGNYENLSSHVDRLEGQLREAKASIETAKSNAADALLEKDEANAAASMAATEGKVLKDQIRTLRDEVKSLKELNPEGLKAKNVSQKKELKEKSDIIGQQLIKIRTLRAELADVKGNYAKATDNVLSLKETCEEQHERLCSKDGLMLRTPYQSKGDDRLMFYMHYMGYNLEVGSANAADDAVRLVGDLGFHLVLRTTYCIDAVVNFTTWLSPVLPSPQWLPLIAEVPDGLIADLHEEIYERVKESHPDLVKRVDWAKGVFLAELDGIKDKHLEPLRKGGFTSLYDVCEVPLGRVAERCDGLEKAAEKDIRKVCDALVSQWRIENKFSESSIKAAA
ncbi:hypothetical protein [Vibrio sonorensis]|uniref:hypothetical protein n=1 Tax=Vibrio sonorensis TaxID=1004316 RepID=UPI0008DA0304|nr:hypothetical protein [Vibrio sonorensis]